MPLLDEHGLGEGVPSFVTPATTERWLVCEMIAENITQQPGGVPENTMFAKHLFDSPLQLGDVQMEEFGPTERGKLKEARELAESLRRPQWRDRLGLWIDMPDTPKRSVRRPLPPESPGTIFTEEEIAEAGLDKWPEKGKAATGILGDAADTAEIHSTAEPASPGTVQKIPYSEERTKLHDKIIAHFMKGKVPPRENPHAVYTAGGPASGKSTLIEHNPELLPNVENTIHIDPDEIKEMMEEYQQLRAKGDRYAATAVHRESGDIAARLLFEAMDAGYHVVIDGTGNSDPGSFTRQLEMAKAREYTVDVLYVNAPTDQAISWSIRRAEEEGRFVPVPVIRDQHAKVSQNFADEIIHLDWLNMLDIIDQGHHIATWQDGKLKILGDTDEERAQNSVRLGRFVNKQEESRGE